MDWNTLAIATIPAIITALISGFASYISANKNAKAELEKAKLDQEIALKRIESEKNIAIETIEKSAESELQKMRAQTQEQIELYKSKAETDMEMDKNKVMLEHSAPLVTSMLSQMFGGETSPEAVETKLKNMQKMSERINNKRRF